VCGSQRRNIRNIKKQRNMISPKDENATIMYTKDSEEDDIPKNSKSDCQTNQLN
jgi:hypothetical protein